MSEEDKLAWREFADPLWKKMTFMIEECERFRCMGLCNIMAIIYLNLLQTKAKEQTGESNAYSNALLAKDLNLVDELVTEESLKMVL